jgi:hypothetical protein
LVFWRSYWWEAPRRNCRRTCGSTSWRSSLSKSFSSTTGRDAHRRRWKKIITIHVMKAPPASGGKTAAAVMRGWTFSCLKPEVTQLMQMALAEDGSVLQSANREVKGQIRPGTVLEDMSMLACDHLNPRGHTETFTGLKAALEFARGKFAGN